MSKAQSQTGSSFAARLRMLSIGVCGLLLVGVVGTAPSYGAVKSGASCKKVGMKVNRSGVELQCKKRAGKNLWVKVAKKTTSVPIAVATPAATPTPSPTPKTISARTKPMPVPTPGISTYRGGGGNASRPKEMSFELPLPVVPAPPGTNVKIWVYDPDNRSRALGSGGIFFQKSGEDWKFLNGNSDGSVYANWSAGNYSIDTVEPGGRASEFIRKRYSANVSATGEFSINTLTPNSAGYFTLTIYKVVPKKPYVAENACKLADQTGNPRGAVGFPRAEFRLPSEGKIDALIIPVDFVDVPGRGDPKEEFREMVDGTAQFFYSQSDGRVQFNFQSLDTWLRAPFKSDAYQLGAWNQGDPGGYFSAVLALADPLVDYSLFDAVYVLSPKEIPASSIAYGPAFVSMPGDEYVMTNEGLVANGTISGADAWKSMPGAGWKWMAHETGHLFGLHDLYTVEDPGPYGSWDIMSLNWTTEAIALNAWNRYSQGWLANEQVKCLETKDLSNPVETLIIPIERDVDGFKALMVPLSSSKILVLESRRSEGVDVLSNERSGLLVYTVDMTIESIKGGWKTQRRPGSTQPDFSDAALKAGDKITVGSIHIEVLTQGTEGDTVRVSRS